MAKKKVAATKEVISDLKFQYYVTPILICILVGCSGEVKKTGQVSEKGEVEIGFSQSIQSIPSPIKVDKQQILGAWKGDYDDSENATIGIYEDSIFNVDHMVYMPYELRGDTLTTNGYESVIRELSADTMIWESENQRTIYHRFKD